MENLYTPLYIIYTFYEMYIKKILFDDSFRKTVLENSKLFLDTYLVNQGNASKSLAKSIFNLIWFI